MVKGPAQLLVSPWIVFHQCGWFETGMCDIAAASTGDLHLAQRLSSIFEHRHLRTRFSRPDRRKTTCCTRADDNGLR